MTNRLPFIFVVALLLSATPAALAQPGGGPVAVRTEPVENRDARVGQALVATIEPVTQTTLAAEQAGLVTERTFDDGSTLEEGQVLVRMDTSLTKLERDAAQAAADAMAAQVEQTKIKAENSQREANRMKGLFEGKIIPEKEFLDALTVSRTDAAIVLTRAAEHAQKKAQVALLDLMIKKSEVRTPLGKGIVAKRYVEVGQWVKQGDPVADVIWMDPVFVRTSVPEAFIGQVKQGEQVTFTLDAIPDKPFTGEISQVLPVADPVSRTFTVKVLVKNPEGLLRPGFFARATLMSRSGRQFLVPKDALVTAPDGQHVVVARDGKAVVLPIKRGPADGGKVVVTGELKEGDQVVTRGNETLRGGEDLQIQNAAPAPAVGPAGG